MKDPEIVFEIIRRVRVVGFGKSYDVGKALRARTRRGVKNDGWK